MALARKLGVGIACGLAASALCCGCRSAPHAASVKPPANLSDASPQSRGAPAGETASAVVPASHAILLPSQLAAATPATPSGRMITAPVVPELAGEHRVEEYVVFALRQNADVQAARLRVAAMANRAPQAASLEDPMLEANYPSKGAQFAFGFQQYRVSQKVPWPGKLRTRAAAAEDEVDVARADLAAAELQVIADVKQAYYQLYILQKSIEITSRQRELLASIFQIATAKYEAGLVSQQDVLRSGVEISSLDNELISLGQQLQSAQARLARLLHVSPETGPRAMAELPAEQLPSDVERLYETAIRRRPELQAQLAAIRRDRRQIELARLNYRPDIMAGAMYMQMPTAPDAIISGVSMNVPIYRKRLAAAVREAEAATAADRRKYDSLRDRTQEETKDLFARIEADRQMLQLFRGGIIPQADQTLQVSIQGYEAGKVDYLQMLDNWRQLFRYRLSAYRLEGQLRQDLAELERIVGGSLAAENPQSSAAPPRETD